jgi:choline dehydrogenase
VAVYDYVIIGAGSAGCVLALRLTENPSTRVLLIEAGPPDDADEVHIPAALSLLFQSTYDWDFRTVPQERAAGRSIYWPRGRMLGGSSSINAMIYIRGSRHDYDTWRDEYGCSGWGYDDLMPYFRRAEGNSRGADAYHGGTGPLAVSDLVFQSPLSKLFVAAARECGLAANEDFNGAHQDGSGFYQVTQKDGSRWSAADAYLRPAMTRPNLEVLTDALVTKIVVEGGRAAGIRYLLRGKEETAYAQGEVILSAGAIGSPQLLMLSGIGPADHLRDVGVPVLVDSPGVGANLSDHPVVPTQWRTPGSVNLWEKLGPAQLIRWRLRHSGPLTSNIAEAGGFSRTRPSLPAPDLQWHALPTPFVDQGLADPQYRAFTLLVGLIDVGSRGRVWLRSADPSPRSTPRTCPTARTSSRWSRGSGWRASSPRPARSPRSVPRSWRPGRRCIPTRRYASSSGAGSAPCTTRSAPAPWAATRGWPPRRSPASSTRSCGYAASRACGWSTPRSCRSCPGATPTPPRSPLPSAPRTSSSAAPRWSRPTRPWKPSASPPSWPEAGAGLGQR